MEGLLALLKDDATFSMPPTPSWYRGRANIRALITETIFSGKPERRWRLLPTRANGQPAFGVYKWDEGEKVYGAYGIQVVTLTGQVIADITTFRNPVLASIFKLPRSL